MNAMPFGPSENMLLQAQLAGRRGVLREEITAALQDLGKAGAGLAGQVHDLKDESLAEMLTDMRLADMHRDIQELRDVDAALARMQAGSYGICVDCGETIPLPRLKAYPTAKRCRPCQERYEQEGTARGRIRS